MASRLEETISATAFKARCLELMDRLARHELDRVFVTKRGKVVSVLAPPPADAAPARGFDAIFGTLKGSTNVAENHEWEAPAQADSAQSARFEEKFKHLL